MTRPQVNSHYIFYFAASQTSFLYCPPWLEDEWSTGGGVVCVCIKIHHHCHLLHLQDVKEVHSPQSSEPQRPSTEQVGPEKAEQGCRGAPTQHWHILSMSKLPSEPWSCSTAAWLHRNKFLPSHCSHHLVPNQNRFKLFHSKNNSDQETLCQITGRGSSFLLGFLNLATLIYQSHMDMRLFQI